ncbi:MvaI/BcnI family restriction endonuclease [Serratia ureilytica]|uniref:MvaI/BcnI family restriction endonuclease n=2 Tax=Serratia TaxID=613 RepID=UPI0018D91C61|nr:MvaI/BcnI family restriction endonuclease [Serratia ureilytica]HEI9730847.1 hypothetical protein [Serratia marcescens]MBH2515595.1 hypothetical protein [Serratia ureilytica]MBH2532161.1 hypothetical protein [Serratia ureilytica]MCU6263246.1 MvaI/BcnI restriction endonuclease family protein [Serratia ureilytica]HEI9760354.1 hypothetical protein [Serratia marcescens]
MLSFDPSFDQIKSKLLDLGVDKILIKVLSSNDNSKQQIYLGSDFNVIKEIPSGCLDKGETSKSGDVIFKSKVEFYWINEEWIPERAPNAQLILYPNYPEVRLSGLLKGCKSAPSALMKYPTREEREKRKNKKRILILGIKNKKIISYISHWDSILSSDINSLIDKKSIKNIFSVFYEYKKTQEKNSKDILIKKLKEITKLGYIDSQRLNKHGEIISYTAKNGAGFTLESLFGIRPNGNPEPDFIDWELKAHSGRVVTLMTPEPNLGLYHTDFKKFISDHATSRNSDRIDFASIHKVSKPNERTGLSLDLEGFESTTGRITNPNGGLMLRNKKGELICGWSFSKLLDHWKRKHNKTCFVSYEKSNEGSTKYKFGPKVTIATGADFLLFFSALSESYIYYDPGINVKMLGSVNITKKRNQFRIKFNDIYFLYKEVEDLYLA